MPKVSACPFQATLLNGCRSVALASTAVTVLPCCVSSMPKVTPPARDWMEPFHDPIGAWVAVWSANDKGAPKVRTQETAKMTTKWCFSARVNSCTPEAWIICLLGYTRTEKNAGTRYTARAQRCRPLALPPGEGYGRRLNDRVLGPELQFQTLHLVFQAEFQLLQAHFFELFFFGKILLLNQAFETLLVFGMFLGQAAKLIIGFEKLITYLSCHSVDLRRDET